MLDASFDVDKEELVVKDDVSFNAHLSVLMRPSERVDVGSLS